MIKARLQAMMLRSQWDRWRSKLGEIARNMDTTELDLVFNRLDVLEKELLELREHVLDESARPRPESRAGTAVSMGNGHEGRVTPSNSIDQNEISATRGVD